MPKNSYQYGTSPRKYEPDYITIRKKDTTIEPKKVNNKKITKTKKIEKTKKQQNTKTKNVKEGKHRALQVVIVLAIFGMLLTVSYREIAIMEMFNQKK